MCVWHRDPGRCGRAHRLPPRACLRLSNARPHTRPRPDSAKLAAWRCQPLPHPPHPSLRPGHPPPPASGSSIHRGPWGWDPAPVPLHDCSLPRPLGPPPSPPHTPAGTGQRAADLSRPAILPAPVAPTVPTLCSAPRVARGGLYPLHLFKTPVRTGLTQALALDTPLPTITPTAHTSAPSLKQSPRKDLLCQPRPGGLEPRTLHPTPQNREPHSEALTLNQILLAARSPRLSPGGGGHCGSRSSVRAGAGQAVEAPHQALPLIPDQEPPRPSPSRHPTGPWGHAWG